MSDTLLHTQSLTKQYGNFCALHQLNLTLNRGEVFGLLGPNGSGKTTALRLILGFLKPTGGTASIAGHDSWHDGVAAREHVTYLPGELRLYENMTGRQLIKFLSEIRGQDLTTALEGLQQRFDIDVDRPLSQMSSGMKRKVALLQVLVLQTPLIIMDEPTNTLDPNMRTELLHQVKLAKDNGRAVLFSSHVMSEVEQVCDRVGILQKGRLVHEQKMSDLQEGRRVKAHFCHSVPDLPNLPGLKVLSRNEREVVLEYTGESLLLFEWLGRQPLEDLQMEQLGLAPIYHQYHGNNEA